LAFYRADEITELSLFKWSGMPLTKQAVEFYGDELDIIRAVRSISDFNRP